MVTVGCLSALLGIPVAIWGVIKRKEDSWTKTNENANLGEFDGWGNGEVTNEQGKVLIKMTRQK